MVVRTPASGGLTALALGAALLLGSASWCGAEASGTLDDVVLNDVCDNVASGSALEAQCAVFDLDAPNRAAAASGNNLGVIGGQGRSKIKIRERLDELRKEDKEAGTGGSSADWAIGKLGLFIAGDATFADRDATDNEVGNDTNTFGFTAGGDWRFSDAVIAGLAFTFSRGETDFDGSTGNLDSNSYGGLGYLSITPNDYLYIDLYGGYAMSDYNGRRNITFTAGGVPVNEVANIDTDGGGFTAGGSIGADFAVGAWTLGPHAGIDATHNEVNAFTESGGSGFDISFEHQTVVSVQSVAGAHASYAYSAEWGVLVPYARLDWVHEFSDKDRSITASFASAPGVPFIVRTDGSDRDFGRAAIGVSAVWPNGWVGFVDYQYQFAHSFLSEHKLSLGIRKEF